MIINNIGQDKKFEAEREVDLHKWNFNFEPKVYEVFEKIEKDERLAVMPPLNRVDCDSATSITKEMLKFYYENHVKNEAKDEAKNGDLTLVSPNGEYKRYPKEVRKAAKTMFEVLLEELQDNQ